MDLDQPGLGMTREYLMKGIRDDDIQAYLTYIKDIAILLGGDPQIVEKEMEEILIFEIDIANITLPRYSRDHVIDFYKCK